MFGEGEEDQGEEEESESSAGAVESFWRCKAVYQREDGVAGIMCYSGFFMLMEDYYHPPRVSHTLSCSFHSVFYICFSVVRFYQSFSLE